jgi:glycosyltransferase involved in cell wall biosynthesis
MIQNKSIIPGLVSIGLPTFNRASLIKKALDSLLAQTYGNFELIISDNCSTDETEKVCREYAIKDKRISYIKQKENIGLIANSLFVLTCASGEYFMWACDDDWWDTKFIELLKKPLDENPDYGVAMSSFVREYTDGEWHSQLMYSGGNDLTNLTHEENFYKMAWPKRPMQCVLLGLHRTEFIKRFMNRPYPKCERHDRVMAAEFALCTKIYTLPDILYKKTMHEISPLVRHKETYDELDRPWRHHRYFYQVGRKVILSGLVPFSRKITFLPSYIRFGIMLIVKKTLLRKVLNKIHFN